MKKSASTMLLVILIFSTCIPSFAQQTKRIRNTSIAPATVAEYEGIKAFSDGQGVYIRWDMRTELNNIGFLVSRMGDNGFEVIAPMIMGSYSKVRGKVLEGAGYEYYDPSGTLNSVYLIENRFTSGNQVSTNSFSPKYTADFLADTGHTKAELEERANNRNGNVRRENLALPSDLQAVVDRSVLPPDPAGQRIVVTQPGVKIAVKKEGMYRVTRAELLAAGFDVSSNAVNWRLFTDGNEQAIIVEPTGQYVDFYGKGIDVRETDTRTYFLIADTVTGKRVTSKFLGNIGGNVFSNSFRAIMQLKERTFYEPKIKNGEAENYFGRAIYPTLPPCPNPNPPNAPCLSFNLDQIDPAGALAVATTKIQTFYPNSGPHSTRVLLNGHELGQVTGTGPDPYSGDMYLPVDFLVEGANQLRFATVQSSNTDFFDTFRLTYSRKYQANQNSLLFYTPGYRKINVNGFSSPNIRVFDATLDGNPQLVTDLPITQNGSTYSVRLPSNRPAVMYAVENSGLLQVFSVTPDSPSSLATTNNLADVIIISNSAPDFMAASETWANYRRSTAGGGFNVKVVNVEDIYDEFSYGAHSSYGVKQFLLYAKNNWQNPKPRYALIIGDASTDVRNYKGLGYNDLVPSLNVDLIYEETYSDEALADSDHNGLAELAIGRVPARNSFVIDTVFNKTRLFETPANQSLDRGALFAFDRPDGYDFRAMSLFLASQLPSSMPKTFVSLMLPPDYTQIDPMAHENLINAINTGQYIVNYSGHGQFVAWRNSGFFSVNDVPSLTNADKPSIFTMLTCFNGFFMWDENNSLGEALLNAPNGGAAATWASTTETTPDYQSTMGARFYQKIGEGNIKRIGDLVIDAKTVIAGSDVGYSWALLGDPALKVRQ